MSAPIENPSSQEICESVSNYSWAAPDAPQMSSLHSVLIASLIFAGLLAAAYWVRLPSLAGAAFYLFFAVQCDLRTSRIPNWLNASGLLAALMLALSLGGGVALAAAVLGAILGLLPALLLYSVGVLGAGDAKGIAVLGALYGPLEVPGLYMWMILSGGVLSITLLVAKGELRSFLGRWAEMVKALLFSGRFVHMRPEAGSTAAGGIPFAVCMAVGSIAQSLWSWV